MPRASGRMWDMLQLVRNAIVLLPLSVAAYGQSSQQFDVAVIRPSVAAANAGTSFNLYDGGRLKITNEPVKLLIRAAFQVQNAQIAGGPGWLDTDRYDIEAKTGRPEKIQQGESKQLLQSLLADRFSLKFHKETREITVYALIADKPKLKVKAEGEVSAMNTGGNVSMELLAGYLGNRLGRIVVDKTGLTDGYDFTLEWTPDQASDSSAPSLVTAVHEQLGLRLESQKSPVEVIVIDSIQKPSEN